MRLNIPLFHDNAYRAGVPAKLLDTVHYSLALPGVPDARHACGSTTPQQLAEQLTWWDAPHKVALLNARFHAPETYTDAHWLDQLASALNTLADAGQCSGVVFTDLWLLAALGAHMGSDAERLAAIPSVNCMLDTPARTRALLERIERTGFALPTTLMLDREVNRDMGALARLRDFAHARGMRVQMLANEGCVPHCPWKPAHNALIAHTRLSKAGNSGSDGVRRLCETSCLREVAEEPWRVLASPFIRPEDVNAYEGHADILKLCGRTRGAAWLTRMVRAYVAGTFDGNLFDLLDAPGDVAEVWHLNNAGLPKDFLQRMVQCAERGDGCTACGDCEAMAKEAGLTKRVPSLAMG